jgi:hypothetical protein
MIIAEEHARILIFSDQPSPGIPIIRMTGIFQAAQSYPSINQTLKTVSAKPASTHCHR